MAQQQAIPVVLLPEGYTRTQGRDAQRMNIMAAKMVAEAVRTTLGPKGMDKMLVDDLGDIVITNDGATIVDEMKIEHPAAKMIVEVAKTQDEEVGDGTTTAVVVSGELLKNAENLLDQGIHPSVIVKGYRMSAEKSMEILDKIAVKTDINDEKLLRKIAETAMTGKGAETAKEHLSDLAVRAVKMVAEKQDGKIEVDLDNIKLEKKQGSSIGDTELISGVIIDKEVVHDAMPKRLTKAKIALLDSALEVKETETDAEIRITSPDQLQAFLDQEEKMLKGMVDKVAASGANVLICQKGIDDVAQHYLSKKGVMAARRAKKSDMEALAKATGARVVTSVEDLSSKELGSAGLVEEKKISGDKMIFVQQCKDPKAVSVLIRGGTEHVVDEAERAFKDAIGGVAASVEVGKIVTGAGAPEIEIAKGLREYAESVGGREQLAINAFADSVEIIPRTLAESAGLDAIDILVEMRSKHDKEGAKIGFDVYTGKVKNMWEKGVVEPQKIKTQAIKSAAEAVELILRIDDVIASSSKDKGPAMPPGGMGGGMGDMEM
ncbi:MAG: TCP-1/cpn60 chaperonin family protein [Candidatus Altiarchaeota archaeon]|nr:TCP-1/cpn60 chaperonin family protein [Candidatus Altiarchaeota archaeon]